MIKAVKSLAYISRHPAVRGKAIYAMWRYVMWQLVSRLSNLEFQFLWVNDSKLNVRRNEAMITHSYYVGLLEYEDMVFALRYLRKSDIFFDIGANSGLYTILAAKCVGAKVYAVEPVIQTFGRLYCNCRLNNIEDDVFLFNMALGSGSGEVVMTSDRDATNHVYAVGDKAELINVKCSTVDIVCDEYNFIPEFIKIDVEGYEKFVLDAAIDVLSSPSLNVVLIEFNGSGEKYGISDNSVANLLQTYGFKPYKFHPERNFLEECLDDLSDGLNTLMIKDIDKARERLQSSELEIVVHNAATKH